MWAALPAIMKKSIGIESMVLVRDASRATRAALSLASGTESMLSSRAGASLKGLLISAVQNPSSTHTLADFAYLSRKFLELVSENMEGPLSFLTPGSSDISSSRASRRPSPPARRSLAMPPQNRLNRVFRPSSN